MDEDLMIAVTKELKNREQKRRAAEFRAWCRQLEEAASEPAPKLRGAFAADVELQPHRWLSAGMDLLESQKVAGWVQLMDGERGPPMDSFLPYAVFQMGAEIFLKGMWLCQFPDSRKVAHLDYVAPDLRTLRSKGLKKLSHDLVGIIEELRTVPEYQADPVSMRFLQRVEGVIRQHYFPLYAADQLPWANSRYPKRFYDDAAKKGSADAYQSYPQQALIIRLFAPMPHHLDLLWKLRRGLMKTKA